MRAAPRRDAHGVAARGGGRFRRSTRGPRGAGLLLAGLLAASCAALFAEPAPASVPSSASPAPASPSGEPPRFCAVPGDPRLPLAACALLPAARLEGGVAVLGAPAAAASLAPAFAAYFGLSPAPRVTAIEAPPPGFLTALPERADVVDASVAGIASLVGAGRLAATSWDGWALGADDRIAEGAAVYTHAVVPAALRYDPRRVAAAELPQAYPALLDARWRGRIALVTPSAALPSVALSLNDLAGAGPALTIARGLAAAGVVRAVRSEGELRRTVIAGDALVGLGAAFDEPGDAALGIGLVEPVALARSGSAVLRDARSPALAALWAYWLGATDDGRRHASSALGWSRHLVPATPLAAALAGRRFVLPTDAFELRGGPALGRVFDALFDARRP